MKQPENTTETKEITFKTAETLRTNETKFKAIFEHSLDGILIADPENRKFILANPAMQAITGYTPAELTKLRVDDIHPKKDLASVLDKFNQQARKEIHLAKDVPILRKNQNIIYCDINTGIMELNGRNYLIGIFRDIMEQRQTEAALRESETRYRSLFENMYSGVAVYEAVDDGKDFIFKDFNATGEKIEQAERNAIIGKKVTEAFPGVKKFGLLEILQKVWQTGKTEYLPPSFYQDNRGSGWRENWVYKLPNGEVVAIYNDVTEQKQMNDKLESIVLERTAKLQESEQRYRMLASISPVGIFHLDAEGNCLYANQKFTEITGLTTTQAHANGGWENAIHPDDLEKVGQRWHASIQNNQPFTMEYRFRKPDGKVTWVLSYTAPIINNQQQTIGYVGTFTNITERRETETKLHLQKQQLARHERASAISEVATSLAHQLNQPLTVISSYAQILQNCQFCPQSCNVAQKVVTSAKKASDIIRNLRAFFGNGMVEKSLVNINKLITATTELLTHSHMDVKPITFDLYQPDPILLLDKIQIEQVINNIVENAIEALTKANRSTAKISTDVKNQILTVIVEDNGVGFASHVADKLFEPFFSTKPRGTGIGLAICRSIIEAHGGKLYANSQLGQGAKFWFTLPIINQEE